MTDPVVPLTVIAGYLGAGKTTLLNHLITNAGGRRLVVLVNDFGELNIDADLIADHDGDTYALTNGCVCCTIGDDLGEVLQEIAASDDPPDEIYLEASGVTDGARFAALLTDWHGLAARGAIVVVDAEAIMEQARDRFVGDMVERQLRAADLLVVNKADLVEPAHLERLRAWFESIGADAPLVPTTHGALPAEVVFGTGWERREPAPPHAGPVAANGEAAAHLATMSSAVVRDDGVWDRNALARTLDSLPDGVARVKGFVNCSNGRFVLQMVGRRWRLDPVAPGHGDSPAPIGSDLNGADLNGPGPTSRQTELVVIAVGGTDASSVAEGLRAPRSARPAR